MSDSRPLLSPLILKAPLYIHSNRIRTLKTTYSVLPRGVSALRSEIIWCLCMQGNQYQVCAIKQRDKIWIWVSLKRIPSLRAWPAISLQGGCGGEVYFEYRRSSPQWQYIELAHRYLKNDHNNEFIIKRDANTLSPSPSPAMRTAVRDNFTSRLEMKFMEKFKRNSVIPAWF